MPDHSGLELLRQLPAGLAVVMLSVHDSPALIEQALQAGAKGFLSKRCSPDELIAAVPPPPGGCYLTPDIAHKLASPPSRSPHQPGREVAQLLARWHGGEGHRRAARPLPKTVHVHRASPDGQAERQQQRGAGPPHAGQLVIPRLASYVAIALAASFIFAAGWFLPLEPGAAPGGEPAPHRSCCSRSACAWACCYKAPSPTGRPCCCARPCCSAGSTRRVGMPLWPLILAG